MGNTMKRLLVLMLVLLLAISVFALISCKHQNQPNTPSDSNSEQDNNQQQGGNTSKPTVTINADGGTVNGNFTINDNGTLTPPANPTKAGYVFLGWYKDEACTIIWDFKNDVVTVNITIYIKWGKKDESKPSITVDTTTDTIINGSFVVNDNDTLTPPVNPIRNGYKFDGWYKDAACTIKWNFKKDKVTVNVTIYVKWIRVYDVTFNSNGGSAVRAIEADENTTITKPANPTKNDYVFAGWFKNENCTTAWDFATDKITKDITLYAKWNKIVLGTQGLEYALNADGESYAVSGIGSITETHLIIPSVHAVSLLPQ